jgi:hypothetical protein
LILGQPAHEVGVKQRVIAAASNQVADERAYVIYVLGH